MKRLAKVILPVLLVGIASACYDDTEVKNRLVALEEWGALMAIDNDPGTPVGDYSADPAYTLMQSRAICALKEMILLTHAADTTPPTVPPWVDEVCPSTDPVSPPAFPPTI